MKEKYIKSPLNYTGGKYKLLSEIIPKFPTKINTFIDLFGGGFNVGINVNSQKIIYNDINSYVVELMQYLKDNSTENILSEIDALVVKYNLSKTNKEGFMQLRDYYNYENSNPIVFYTLLCHAFNYQIRFNKDGKYNMPFGKDRSSFNSSLREKFITFVNSLHSKNVAFANKDFTQFDFNSLDSEDFVYCDPPYLNSVATYNEKDGWAEQHEKSLLDILTQLNNKGIKFALSNNLKYGNDLLDNWKNDYKCFYLNADYNNCNYHKADKTKDIEVLITNYECEDK